MTLTLPNLNVELIQDLLVWAYADDRKISEMLAKFPDWGSWDQVYWAREIRNGVCKTAFCMAGQTVVQSGFALNLYLGGEEEVWDESAGTYVATGRTTYEATTCYPAKRIGKDENGRPVYERTGPNVMIEDKAREILGLTSDEATVFFDGDNGISRLVWLAHAFAAVRGVTLNLPKDVAAAALEDY